MLDRCLRQYHNYIVSMFVSPQLPSKPCFIISVLLAILQLLFVYKGHLTLSFQTWIGGRLVSSLGALHGSGKWQIASDQIIYLAFPIVGFQFGLLTALLLVINNYMEMHSEKYKDRCIVGHTEIFIAYTACYLFPEFFVNSFVIQDIILLNFMGLVVLSIISGVLIGFQCKM